MAIYISLKKNEKTSLADRITSTIQFSKRLLSQYNFMESSAKIYELVRIEQDSETFDVEDLNVGQKIANRIAIFIGPFLPNRRIKNESLSKFPGII